MEKKQREYFRSYKKNEVEFKKRLDNILNHWCGDHINCNHAEKTTRKKYQLLKKDSEEVRALVEVIEGIKKNASKFASRVSSNMCEVVNNEIIVYALK